MSEEGDSRGVKVAFLGLDKKLVFEQALEDRPDVLDVFREGVRKNEEI